jgi:hypothetical protein
VTPLHRNDIVRARDKILKYLKHLSYEAVFKRMETEEPTFVREYWGKDPDPADAHWIGKALALWASVYGDNCPCCNSTFRAKRNNDRNGELRITHMEKWPGYEWPKNW